MTDDYKRGLVTGLAMQPLVVSTNKDVSSGKDTFFVTETFDRSNYSYGLVNFGVPGQSGFTNLMNNALTAISENLGLTKRGDTLFGFGDFKMKFFTNISSSSYKIYAEVYSSGNTVFYGEILSTINAALPIKEYVLCFYKTSSGDSMGFNLCQKGNEASLKVILTKDENGNAACILPFSHKGSIRATTYDHLICGDDSVGLVDRTSNAVFSTLCSSPTPNFSSTSDKSSSISAMICKFPNILRGCMFKELFFSVSTSLLDDIPPCYERFTGASGEEFQPVGGYHGGVYLFRIK